MDNILWVETLGYLIALAWSNFYLSLLSCFETIGNNKWNIFTPLSDLNSFIFIRVDLSYHKCFKFWKDNVNTNSLKFFPISWVVLILMYINIVSTQFHLIRYHWKDAILLLKQALCLVVWHLVTNSKYAFTWFVIFRIKEKRNFEPFWNDQMLLVFRFETHVWLSVLIVICCTQED